MSGDDLLSKWCGISHDAVSLCTAYGPVLLLLLLKCIDGLIDFPSALSIYALILVVILLLIAMEHLPIFGR